LHSGNSSFSLSLFAAKKCPKTIYEKQCNLIFIVPQKSTADKMNADADSLPFVHFTAIAALFINLTLLRISRCIFMHAKARYVNEKIPNPKS